MAYFIIIFTGLIVVAFTALSYYTSINKGANKMIDWLKRYDDKQKPG
jgi:hypothetical protein